MRASWWWKYAPAIASRSSGKSSTARSPSDAALGVLEEAGVAEPVPVPDAERGRGRGRPTERWVATANKAKKMKTAVYQSEDPASDDAIERLAIQEEGA
jgi:hypothetical protein